MAIFFLIIWNSRNKKKILWNNTLKLDDEIYYKSKDENKYYEFAKINKIDVIKKVIVVSDWDNNLIILNSSLILTQMPNDTGLF